MKEYFINRVTGLLSRVTLSCLGKEFKIIVSHDRKFDYSSRNDPRVYIQIEYTSSCNKTGEEDVSWKGSKWYLSEHMIDDEIIKRCYAAFKAAVEHEIMEGFLVDQKILFNPHVDFEELLKISNKEVKRENYVTEI